DNDIMDAYNLLYLDEERIFHDITSLNDIVTYIQRLSVHDFNSRKQKGIINYYGDKGVKYGEYILIKKIADEIRNVKLSLKCIAKPSHEYIEKAFNIYCVHFSNIVEKLISADQKVIGNIIQSLGGVIRDTTLLEKNHDKVMKIQKRLARKKDVEISRNNANTSIEIKKTESENKRNGRAITKLEREINKTYSSDISKSLISGLKGIMTDTYNHQLSLFDGTEDTNGDQRLQVAEISVITSNTVTLKNYLKLFLSDDETYDSQGYRSLHESITLEHINDLSCKLFQEYYIRLTKKKNKN
ncbi:MAG: hypothetical protein GY828_07105, partial [Candidatus Gracilibacteria bacterium]|nr:hypothetical protein [Candidatus Gracilibacteria bacterium]